MAPRADNISIGNGNVFEDDDWQVIITSGPPLTAFAFNLVGNFTNAGESFAVYGPGNVLLGSTLPPTSAQTGSAFLGVVSTVPIERFHFNEGATGDNGNDIGVADFRFPENMLDVNSDLAVIKTDNPDPVEVGNNLTYTLFVTNFGPSNATGVTMTDTLPADPSFVSATPTQGSCSETTGTVTCNLGSLAVNADATVTLVVTPTAAGTITNTARVTGDQTDPTPANDSETAVTTVTSPPTTTTTEPPPTTTTLPPPTTTTTVPPPRFTCNGLPATIVGTNGNNTLTGTPGNDVIHGLGGNDTIRGGGGDDVICGGNGNDRLLGEQGLDRLLGQVGNDTLQGGTQNDQLFGAEGNDRLLGEDGNDTLRGGSNNDQLFGQNGNDNMNGEQGTDTCNGGSGTDTATNCETRSNVP